MRMLDWSATPFGTVKEWPQALRTSVRMMLSGGYAMATLWGPDHTYQYNNAFCPLVEGWDPVTHRLEWLAGQPPYTVTVFFASSAGRSSFRSASSENGF